MHGSAGSSLFGSPVAGTVSRSSPARGPAVTPVCVATPTRPPSTRPAKLSKVETIKDQSDYLRHPLMEEIASEASTNINEAAAQLMKFHGSYQQDNRDKRTSGKGKFYQFMMRTRQPAGLVSNQLYLVMDTLADKYGNGTLRLTTRQTYQLHGVLKEDLKTVFSSVIKNMGSTLGACGDVNRNVLAPPAPFKNRPEYAFCEQYAQDIADLLAPQSGAYYDIWLDGEKFFTHDMERPEVTAARMDNPHGTNFEGSPEPIYGNVFLPRKFKIAITVPGDNSVDLFTNDLGLVVITDPASGELQGFNILVGGGMGRAHRNNDTFARITDALGYVPKEDIFAAVKAIVATQRDYGRRDDRRQARLKYLVQEWGIDRFRTVTEQYYGKKMQPFKAMPAWEYKDYLGWTEQGDGNLAFGVFVQSGRLKGEMKAALRRIIERYELPVRLTPEQNLILCDIDPQWRNDIISTLQSAGVEIYRVPGSVSFLHSGSLLHAVLPRSQCWCVDGISKFALRVLSDTYYRIELPSASPEDLEKVEELKAVLAKVLFYERTACPFDRGFGDELPTTEELDGRKKTRRRSHGPAKRWTMDRAYSWKPEDGGQPPRRLSEESEGSGDATSSEGDVESETEKNTDRVVGKVNEETPVTTPSRPAGLEAMRSITAPPQLTVHSTPPSRIRTRFVANETQKLSEPVHTETPRLDPARLRTFQPIPTDMPPSPPDSSAGNELAEMPSRIESTVKREPEMNEETAEEHDQLAVEAESEPRVDSHEEVALDMDEEPANRSSHLAETPPKDAHAPTMQQQPTKRTVEEQPATLTRQRSPEDPFAAIQARILARRSIGGTTSFHPSRSSPPRSSSSSTSSTATLASQRSTTSLPRSREQQQTLASALVKKACAVFLGPPAHLVAIMLKIAARFANGAMGMGASFIIETPRGHKRVPGSFDLRSVDADDFDEDEDERGLEEWEEDDFGVPLRSPIRLAQRASEGAGDVRLRRGLGND